MFRLAIAKWSQRCFDLIIRIMRDAYARSKSVSDSFLAAQAYETGSKHRAPGSRGTSKPKVLFIGSSLLLVSFYLYVLHPIDGPQRQRDVRHIDDDRWERRPTDDDHRGEGPH